MALLVPELFDQVFFDLAPNLHVQNCKGQKVNHWPKVDINEEEDKFVVHADVPGVPKDQLKLEIKDNGITLSFDQDESKEETREGKTIRRERYHRSFSRTLAIPKGVDKGGITASYENGVLRLALPKAPEELPKAIAIE